MANENDCPVDFALTGAGGAFARTFLMQVRSMSALRPAVLCDIDLDRVRSTCVSLGYPREQLTVCNTREAVVAARARGEIALIARGSLLEPDAYGVLVEATGVAKVGFDCAISAINAGRNVVMVSKETDSVAGCWLADAAHDRGVGYVPADGDQPAKLISLIRWARLLGLDVVAAGKSAEYDVVFDETSATAHHMDERMTIPALGDVWNSAGDMAETLARRSRAVDGFDFASAADYCELTVVANATGLRARDESLCYPLARIPELADVYAFDERLRARDEREVLDVFVHLRRPDEASFAGGVFVVVRCHDDISWSVLRDKGHVVSAGSRFACIYHPFHLMGVETPLSVLSVTAAQQCGVPRSPSVVMAARSSVRLEAGRVLRVVGHHHQIQDVRPEILPVDRTTDGVVPYYLAEGCRLIRSVPPGHLMTLADLTGVDEGLKRAWNELIAADADGAPGAFATLDRDSRDEER